MLVKMIVVLLLLFVLYSLGSALFFLVKDRSRSDRVVKALTWRISVSILIFVFLMVAYLFGWIVPHSI
jgi:hypothetical protein